MGDRSKQPVVELSRISSQSGKPGFGIRAFPQEAADQRIELFPPHGKSLALNGAITPNPDTQGADRRQNVRQDDLGIKMRQGSTQVQLAPPSGKIGSPVPFPELECIFSISTQANVHRAPVSVFALAQGSTSIRSG
jgi:hypothetical protein